MIAAFDGIEIYYEEIGSGTPILMLHGGGCDHRHMIADMEPAFAGHAGWRRIYPDLPGHGRSPVPEGVVNHDDILRVILGFWDAVLDGAPLAVSGTSSGGHLARGLVHVRADRLLGVMLNAAAFETDMRRRQLPPEEIFFEDPEYSRITGPTPALSTRATQPRLTADLARWSEHNYRPAQAAYDEAWAWQSWTPENYAFSFALHPMASPFPRPSLIVCGRQDAIVGWKDALPVLDDYPRTTFAVLDGCGHIIAPVERDLFTAHVRSWLALMAPDAQR